MTSRRDMIRALLAGILSAAGAAPLAHAAGATPSAADFIAFSERLLQAKGLDPGMGPTSWQPSSMSDRARRWLR